MFFIMTTEWFHSFAKKPTIKRTASFYLGVNYAFYSSIPLWGVSAATVYPYNFICMLFSEKFTFCIVKERVKRLLIIRVRVNNTKFRVPL